MEQPSTERTVVASVMHDVSFVSFEYLMPNMVETVEIVLTFCGIREAVLSPYQNEGTLCL